MHQWERLVRLRSSTRTVAGAHNGSGMRTRLAVVVALAISTLVLSAGPALAAGPCGNDFDMTSACAVTSPYSASGSYAAGNEKDYYVFHAAPNTQLSVTIADTESPNACSIDHDPLCGVLYATLYDADGDQLAQSSQSNPEQGAGSLSHILTAASTYYVVVDGYVGTDSGGGPRAIPYTLGVTASPAVVWPYTPPPASWSPCKGFRFGLTSVSSMSARGVSCASAGASLRRGVLRGPRNHWNRFTTAGYRCVVLSVMRGSQHRTIGMHVSCSSATRAFRFAWRF